MFLCPCLTTTIHFIQDVGLRYTNHVVLSIAGLNCQHAYLYYPTTFLGSELKLLRVSLLSRCQIIREPCEMVSHFKKCEWVTKVLWGHNTCQYRSRTSMAKCEYMKILKYSLSCLLLLSCTNCYAANRNVRNWRIIQ